MDQNRPKVFRQSLAVIIANLAFFNYGAMVSYASSAGVLLSSEETSDLVFTEKEVGGLSSYLEFGGFLGLPIGAVLLRKLGRKSTLFFAGLMSLLGWTIIYLGQRNITVLVGRFFGGVMVGIIYLAESAYTTEIASPTLRGRLGCQNIILLGLGMNFFAFSIMFIGNWRTVSGMMVLASLVQCVSMFFNYETPVYLLMRNKEEKARQTLQKIRGSRYDISSELSEMKRLADRTKDRSSSILQWTKLKKPDVYKPFAICMGLTILRSGIGYVPMIANMETILQKAGAGFEHVGLAVIVLGAIRLPCSFLLSLLNDRFGRKKMVAITGTLSGLFQILLGLCFVLKAESGGQVWIVQLARTSLFILLCFYMMLGSTTLLLIGELLTPDVKEDCGMIIHLLYFGANGLSTAAFFPMQEIVPIYTIFWIYAFFALMIVIFVGLCIPETKGKSMETINNHFRSRSSTPTDLTTLAEDKDSMNMAAVDIVDLLPMPGEVTVK